MRKRTLILAMSLGLGLAILNAAAQDKKTDASAPSAATASAAVQWQIDPVHSSVLFRIKHLDAAYFYGRFNEVSGNILLDEAQPEKSSLDIQVAANSVDTHSAKRDQHLKSPDFFNAAEFPTIAFKSKSVKKVGENRYQAEGDFTLLGVTKLLTVEFEKTGQSKDARGTERVGAETTFTIKRSDHGMTFMADGLSDEVRITVSLEAVRGKAK